MGRPKKKAFATERAFRAAVREAFAMALDMCGSLHPNEMDAARVRMVRAEQEVFKRLRRPRAKMLADRLRVTPDDPKEPDYFT